MFLKYFFRKNLAEFDSNIWKSHPEKRKYYVKYILDNKLGIGKSKTEIENLFGQEKIYSEDRWSYFINAKAKKKYSLAFYFENNKVVKIRKEYKIK